MVATTTRDASCSSTSTASGGAAEATGNTSASQSRSSLMASRRAGWGHVLEPRTEATRRCSARFCEGERLFSGGGEKTALEKSCPGTEAQGGWVLHRAVSIPYWHQCSKSGFEPPSAGGAVQPLLLRNCMHTRAP